MAQPSLLSDPHLVLEPKDDALVRMGPGGLVQRVAEPLFSNLARAFADAFGCIGRAFWCENPSRRRIRDRLCGVTLLPKRSSMAAAGIERQALRDAVTRYNAEGLASLVDRPGPGRRPALTEGELALLAERIFKGPDPQVDGVST